MTTWFDSERISKLVGAAAVALAAALTVGCGPAPGYEPEPRMPGAYSPQNGPNTEPLSSEELAARYEAEQRGDIAIGASQSEEYSDTDPSALTEFKPALEGHGQWIDDSTYGTVWQPNEAEVGTDFVPYVSAGSWTYDDTYGYTWVSTYDWGWAPFHYGRWVHVHRGWVWIPGRTYSGAWVSWRYGGPSYGYVGWAPMGPDWYWYNGVAVGWTFGYNPYYVYCPHSHMYDHHVVHHVVQGPPARAHDGNTREYALANPQVGGAGGANGGGDRVLANPQVGGRQAANPRVAGPKPSELGIPPEKVAPTPRDNAGIARAQAFGSPHTAMAQGAAAPIQRRSITSSNGYRRDDVVAGQPSPRGPVMAKSPSLSRLDPVARAPQVQSVTPVPPQRAALPELRPAPRQLQPAPGYSSSAPSSTPHTFSTAPSSPSVASRPPMTSSPSVSQPPSAFRSSPSSGSSFSSSPPTIRSSPSVSSQPTFRSSPSVSSSPSFRSSSPSVSSSPSFRSSGSAPSIRSAPSGGSTFRSPSTPSVRRR